MGLFGEAIPSRHDKEHSQSIICNFKPKGESARIIVNFIYGNDQYRIYRSFTKHDNALYQSNVSLECNDKQIHSGSSAVKKWIHDHIDKLDTFLTSCMLTQKVDNDFFSMKHSEQIQLINKSMGLNYVTTITELLTEVKKSCKFIKSLIYVPSINTKQIDITPLKNQKSKLQSEYNRINGKINIFSFAGLRNENDLHQEIDTRKLNEFIDKAHIIPVSECQQQCFLLEKEFESLRSYYDKSHIFDETILKTNPIKMKHTLAECTLWKNQFDKFIQSLISKFGSIDNFIKAQSYCIQEINLTEYNKLVQIISQYESSIYKNSTQNDLLVHEEQISKLENELKKLGPREIFISQPSKPNISFDECNKLINTYRSLIEQSDKIRNEYNNLFQLMEKKKNVVAEIKTIEQSNHPFNSSCWACQKQPWNIRLKNLKSTLYSLPDNLEKQFEEVEKKVNELKNVEKQYPLWQKYQIQWKHYYQYQIEVKLNQEKEIVNNIKKFLTIQSNINNYKQQLFKWNKQQKDNELINLAHSLKSTYNKWISEEKEYDIELTKNYEDYLKACAIQNRKQYNEAKQLLDVALKRDEYKYWIFVSDLIPQYKEQQKLQETLKYITNQLSELSFEIGKVEIQNNTVLEHERKIKEIENVHKQIDFKYMLALEILQQLGNYKKWLYEQVIKSLLDETNRLLSGNEFVLDCKVIMKDGVPNKFNWYINKKNKNMVPINKSGGYVQYMVGLALRISLGRFCSTSFRQLFIDEGFVAADKNNLVKMPDFIRSLLNYYHNIILVSHLDIIRDCGDVCINIERSDGISKLVFGNTIIDNRCNASCKKGGRCKNKAVINGYCKRHVNYSGK